MVLWIWKRSHVNGEKEMLFNKIKVFEVEEIIKKWAEIKMKGIFLFWG